MLKLLLGVLIEVFVAVSLAGLILALTIPLLHQDGLTGVGGITAGTLVLGVLAATVAIAIFRPGSAIRRYVKG